MNNSFHRLKRILLFRLFATEYIVLGCLPYHFVLNYRLTLALYSDH